MKLIINISDESYDKALNGIINCKECFDAIVYGIPIPDNAVTWVDFEYLRDKILGLSCRYSISRERGCGGQVEWSDRLIKQDDVLKVFEEYQKGGKE